MTVRLAIHTQTGEWSGHWIRYCQDHGIAHEIVDCHRTDIIPRLKEFDGLLWHFWQTDHRDLLMARSVLHAAEQMGLCVFPNIRTCWHFDDKLAQKYALEAVDAPLIPSWAFFNLDEACQWLRTAEFPLVAKLRGGAGARGVRLLTGRKEAARYCKRMFGRGIAPSSGVLKIVPDKLKKARSFGHLLGSARKLPVLLRLLRQARHMPRERGYVLFQTFVPDNPGDIRVKVVGDRIWGFLRRNRRHDWRASGSGNLDLDHTHVPPEAVRVARDVADRLGTQSIAYDMLIDPDGRPCIAEISYGFGYDEGESDGYWDRDLQWHDEGFHPWDLMVSNLVHCIRNRAENTLCSGRSSGTAEESP